MESCSIPIPIHQYYQEQLDGVSFQPTVRIGFITLILEQLRLDEGARLKSIRLRALQETPNGFGTTFKQASANSDAVAFYAAKGFVRRP